MGKKAKTGAPAKVDLLFQFAVDTGMAMVVSADKLSEWREGDVSQVLTREVVSRQRVVARYGRDFSRYDEPCPLFGGRTPNDVLSDGGKERMPYLPKKPGLTYADAAGGTCEARCCALHDQGGTLVGVAFSTGYGDGRYTVRKHSSGLISIDLWSYWNDGLGLRDEEATSIRKFTIQHGGTLAISDPCEIFGGGMTGCSGSQAEVEVFVDWKERRVGRVTVTPIAN